MISINRADITATGHNCWGIGDFADRNMPLQTSHGRILSINLCCSPHSLNHCA